MSDDESGFLEEPEDPFLDERLLREHGLSAIVWEGAGANANALLETRSAPELQASMNALSEAEVRLAFIWLITMHKFAQARDAGDFDDFEKAWFPD